MTDTTKREAEAELKNCPFCKSAAQIQSYNPPRIHCKKPLCRGHIDMGDWGNMKDAIAAWNTRASLATPAVPDEKPEPELDWITSMKITSPGFFNPKIEKKDQKAEIESRLEILTEPDSIPAVNKAMLTMWQRMDQIDGEIACKDCKTIKSLNIREIVHEAMQEGWDDIGGDTGCHPLDITRNGKYLSFRPYHWADYIAGFIEQKLLSAAPKQNDQGE